jgi:hypothetical protein
MCWNHFFQVRKMKKTAPRKLKFRSCPKILGFFCPFLLFFFHFCDVTEMVIIYKTFKPNLAISRIWNWKCLSILCFFGLHARTQYTTAGDFLCLGGGDDLATQRQKKHIFLATLRKVLANRLNLDRETKLKTCE